jgi:polar amino acid transport system substrate-binding protein
MRFLFLVITLSLFRALSAPAAGGAEPGAEPTSFIFCYQDIELYPNYTGASAQVPTRDRGVVVELVELAAAEAGLTPVFVRFPWNRCISLLRQGRVDSLVASYRPERADAAAYPMKDGKPDTGKLITLSGYYLYQRGTVPDQWDGTKFTDRALNIGAPLGYSITAELKKSGINVVTTNTTADLFQMLSYGRIDAVAAPGAAADTLLHKYPGRFGWIRKVEAPLRVNPYFIAFSHQFREKHGATVQRVWDNSLSLYRRHFAALQIKYAAVVDTADKKEGAQ